MPVDTLHPEYQRMVPKWKVMRDAAAGQEAIHCAIPSTQGTRGITGTVTVSNDAPIGFIQSPGTFQVVQGGEGSNYVTYWPGEAYLPRLYNEKLPDYMARRNRAGFFNATWRTIAGLAGMLFRIAPVLKVSAVTEPMLEDVTKDGTDADTLALLASLEALTVGRVGLFVDYPRGAPDGATAAEVEALNLRPQMAMYRAEAVINWATSWVNNKTVLSLVVLAEITTLPGEDEFTPKCEPRWRVLDLTEAADAEGNAVGLVYRVRVFRKEEYEEGGKKKVRDVVEDEFYPLMKGAPLRYIPFQFIGVDDTTPSVAEPPLMDLAYTNVSHYQTTADLEHGAHRTSLPQPWIAGINPTVDAAGNQVALEFYMGGGDAWAFPNPGTTVGMLEYTGQGLTSLENRLQAKENQMAVLGARMLEDQKAGVEAAQTAGIHRSGEQATLSSQGRTISKGLEIALGWFDEWAGGSGDAEAALNNDFLPVPMDAQKLTALVGAWQAGAISKETLFDNFKKGEIVRDATDFETEESKIANQPPALLTGAGPTPSPTPAPAPAPVAAG